MILKNIKERVLSVWSLVLHRYQEWRSYLILCLQTARVIGDCLSVRFSKNRMTEPKCPICRLTSWNCGTVLVIIPACIIYSYLTNQRGKFLGKDKKFYKGEYLFTIDWAHPDSNILDTDHSEIPQEHKCAHILELDNGNFAAQPNNRILWNLSHYTTDKFWPDFKVQNTYWTVENKDWVTEDTDKMFYQIEDKED